MPVHERGKNSLAGRSDVGTSDNDPRVEIGRGKETGDEEYSDLLLVDLLHPDWKNFFRRYRVDFWGLLGVLGAVLLMILAAILIAGIGA